ncbi:hypothetical protein HDU91_004440 [Kappamyces sp. JEL0680]|nr:hypothetical protein HDU91_004440 [Kappamyces sp. JEL0680]
MFGETAPCLECLKPQMEWQRVMEWAFYLDDSCSTQHWQDARALYREDEWIPYRAPFPMRLSCSSTSNCLCSKRGELMVAPFKQYAYIAADTITHPFRHCLSKDYYTKALQALQDLPAQLEADMPLEGPITSQDLNSLDGATWNQNIMRWVAQKDTPKESIYKYFLLEWSSVRMAPPPGVPQHIQPPISYAGSAQPMHAEAPQPANPAHMHPRMPLSNAQLMGSQQGMAMQSSHPLQIQQGQGHGPRLLQPQYSMGTNPNMAYPQMSGRPVQLPTQQLQRRLQEQFRKQEPMDMNTYAPQLGMAGRQFQAHMPAQMHARNPQHPQQQVQGSIHPQAIMQPPMQAASVPMSQNPASKTRAKLPKKKAGGKKPSPEKLSPATLEQQQQQLQQAAVYQMHRNMQSQQQPEPMFSPPLQNKTDAAGTSVDPAEMQTQPNHPDAPSNWHYPSPITASARPSPTRQFNSQKS